MGNVDNIQVHNKSAHDNLLHIRVKEDEHSRN